MRMIGKKSRIVGAILLLLGVIFLFPVNVNCDSSQLKRGCPDGLVTTAPPNQVCYLVVKKPFASYVLRTTWHYSSQPKCQPVKPKFEGVRGF
jgi:hypothetical protein